MEPKGVTKMLRVARWSRESCASLVGMEEKAAHSPKPHCCNQLKVWRQEAAKDERWAT